MVYYYNTRSLFIICIKNWSKYYEESPAAEYKICNVDL